MKSCGAVRCGNVNPTWIIAPSSPKRICRTDLLYHILVQIVAGIMRDRSAALQWPEQGLDPNNDDHREHPYFIRYAMQLLTPPPPISGSSDRGAKETKQTVSLWHEFSATHYQGHVQSILRRRRGEGRGAPYSDAVLVRVN
ncbi:BZ3500_MvSof-1268-A1-R1_Chr11-1g03227 [Microbotryum saponariae]|uniref:BZ3500_MvSof-1268-A1-R1_Chr11-1g03227 protein n=1 Tax=Microbotryum saponariae TaxID=289078 RepID=A0A2X0NF87_9BASI|nr:BZ3501_MvSof-1269-A2-R1_Chr11g02802 [Microbotryum saponariae]SDA03787.1 BZ3500_MvSof-1268-A1-R1_Chr11-1g03227 [Microbotryum saponariae]